jgi:hypothetical protein
VGRSSLEDKEIGTDNADLQLTPGLRNTRILIASVVWWSELLATDPEVLVRFPELPNFLRSSGSGTGSTQPREYN